MRATNPHAYDQMALRHRLGRLPEWEPVPDDIDRGLENIRIGERLGVPAPLVPSLPFWCRRDALMSLEVDARLAAYARKQARKG